MTQKKYGQNPIGGRVWKVRWKCHNDPLTPLVAQQAPAGAREVHESAMEPGHPTPPAGVRKALGWGPIFVFRGNFTAAFPASEDAFLVSCSQSEFQRSRGASPAPKPPESMPSQSALGGFSIFLCGQKKETKGSPRGEGSVLSTNAESSVVGSHAPLFEAEEIKKSRQLLEGTVTQPEQPTHVESRIKVPAAAARLF